MKTTVSALLGALALGVSFASVASAADTSVCLITKTDTNPFFVKMKEGATAKANLPSRLWMCCATRAS